MLHVSAYQKVGPGWPFITSIFLKEFRKMSKRVGEIRFNPFGERCINIYGRSDYGFGIDCEHDFRMNFYELKDCEFCFGHGEFTSEYECICDDGYVGTQCEFEDCDLDNGKCLNGGKCNNTNPDYWEDGVDPFICNCPPFYHEQRCQTYLCIDEKDCFNGGVCSEESEGCDCPDGFSGMQCEFEN